MRIGFHHNYAPKRKSLARFSPSLFNRVALLTPALAERGHDLLLYSPRHIEENATDVAGCEYRDGALQPTRAAVPRTNGNWTHRTRRLIDKGMGYQRFARWTEERGVAIYVPHAFSELVGNKLETYRLVRAYHETLHPHCEPFLHEEQQLAHFVDTNRRNFIKPRSGSKGDRIISVRRDADGLHLTRYEKGQRRERTVADTRAALAFVREATNNRRTYVIQHGIDVMRYDGAAFDVRVTMLNDGQEWHMLHEARLSRAGSDVSNISQGGSIVRTEDLLHRLLGAEACQELLHGLRSESFGLANYLERLHPGQILEVAFDFAIDERGALRLLEINTKPGLAGIGSDVRVFDRTPAQEPLFEQWVYPHIRHLAGFLARRAEQQQA